jgi:uncharacterized protein with NRDE domain
VCTVVCRFAPGELYPVQLLALRDELATRAFDLPSFWWADQPDVIGGRDRVAGGTWCATSVPTGVTAVVLNRPDKRDADPGAPSRGVLPLLATRHRAEWPDHVSVPGMAGFNLVLAEPDALRWWWFDGATLQHESLGAGTYKFTPRGLADGMDPRLAAGRAVADEVTHGSTADVWPEWLAVVRSTAPSADPSGFIVRIPIKDNTGEDNSYETVFGQFIATRPGRLRLDHLTAPASGTDREWTTNHWSIKRLAG